MKPGFLIGGGVGDRRKKEKKLQTPAKATYSSTCDDSDSKANDAEHDPFPDLASQLREIKAEMDAIDMSGSSPNSQDGPLNPDWCQLHRRWWQVFREGEEISEERRVAAVVEEIKKDYPAMFEDFECPLCFEISKRSDDVDDSFGGASKNIMELTCCFKKTCTDCAYQSTAKSKFCPFCRFDFEKANSDPKYSYRYHHQLIKDNINIENAHCALGMKYFKAQTQPQKAAKHLRIAADLGNVTALHNLAVLYLEGRGVEQSLEEGHRLSLLAAKGGGFPGTPFNVANSASDGCEAVKWMTFAASEGSFKAQHILGAWYSRGEHGLTRSIEMAIYWIQMAAEQGHTDSQLEMSKMLQFCAVDRYGCQGKFQGYNPWPQIMYWCRRAAGTSGVSFTPGISAQAASLLASFEAVVSSDCSHCGMKKEDCPGGKLIPCQRCKAAYYCNLKCWAKDCKEGGHTDDCVPCG